MPRRVKEEDRIEMTIRCLMKQPDNRRCINCNSLGPQYVCMTFWTFVCADCSGVHREFSHRVKSVSMAKFNDDEIAALQAGGNERAKQIYFRTWDSYSSYPDSSNLPKLREFVNSVYVDRKYTGEKKLPIAKSDSREGFCDWSSRKSRWGRREDYLARSAVERGSNRSRDDEFYDRSLFVKSSSAEGGKGLNLRDFLEERNPRNNQEMPRSSSPSPMEIVDDRFREDGSVKRYERNPFRESGYRSRSPESLRTASSLPVIRPVKAILGDEVPELRIAAPTGDGGDDDDDDDEKTNESSAGGQKAVDASVMRPAGTNEPTNLASLIEFSDAEPETNPSAGENQAEKMASETSNESSSVASSKTQAAAIIPMNSVESLLFELSTPMTASAACTSPMLGGAGVAAPAQMNCTNSTNVDTTEARRTSNSSEAFAITCIATDQPLDRDYTYPVVQDMQTHQLPFTTSINCNTLQTASSVESSLSEQGKKSPAAEDLRRTKSVPVVQSLQAVNPSPSARKEIPLDLFTSGYPSFSQPVSGWQMHMHHGAGYNMQFHPPAMHLATCPPKPNNPFDIDDDRFQVQAPTYPYMSPVQGDISNMQASATSHFLPSPYALLAHTQSHMSAYGMNTHQVPGAYMVQQPYNMLLTRPEGNADYGRSEDVFASLNPIQRRSGARSLPSTPTSPLPRAGNPFG